MDTTQCVVIGAGVIGLAIARALARARYETIVLESAPLIGSGISSRNSEVIHAGIYYPRGSLKAKFCVKGRHDLYAYCDAHGVPYRRCGKLIVATTAEQTDELARLHRSALDNGVTDLRLLHSTEARALEPELHCVSALLSPSTGIIDSHEYMLALQGDAEEHGASLALRTRVIALSPIGSDVAVTLENDSVPSLRARLVVNAAGLTAHILANSMAAHMGRTPVSIYYAKGNYFALAGRSPFTRLIYPMPEPGGQGGLGVHLTLDMSGQVRFGPDFEWVAAAEFDVRPERSSGFYAAVRNYWPALPEGALVPAYAGIRPKLTPPGAPAADFLIQGPAGTGSPGLIDLLGIESPGLTASLAIAEYVARLADTWLQQG